MRSWVRFFSFGSSLYSETSSLSRAISSRGRRCGGRFAGLLASGLALALSLLICSAPPAFGQTSDVQVDELTEEQVTHVEELPDGYEAAMLARSDGLQAVTLGDGAPVLRSVSDDGGSISEVVQQLWEFITSGISAGQANLTLLDDLAWRYYHYTDKRDKVPVQAYGGAKQLSEFESWAQWHTYVHERFLFDYPYRLVGFDDGKSWDSTSPNAEYEYQKWYEYYEGGSQGGTAFDGTVLNSYYLTYTSGNNNGIRQSLTFNLILGETVVTYINNYIQKYWSTQNYIVVGFSYYMGSENIPEILYPTQRALRIVLSTEEPYIENGNLIINNAKTIYLNYNGSLGFTMAGTVGTLNIETTGSIGFSTSSKETFYGYPNSGNTVFSNVSEIVMPDDDKPVYPDYPSPTTPDPPTPPDVPNPGPGPTVTPTDNPSNTSTTTVDLTPILEMLRIINANIDGFESMMAAHADYVQTVLYAMYQSFNGWLANISQQLDDWGNALLDELRTANGWLRGIYYKRDTGSGPNTPDPVLNPTGYGDWWSNLIQKLLGMLPDAVTDFVDALRGLSGVFPFSIPWDVSAILGLLSHEPVTPVFDVPLPTIGADGVTVVPVHVDCSAWDGVAGLVRRCIFLYFALNLALWTRDGLRNWEVD